MAASAALEQSLRDYYTGYYREQLGLPDWPDRVEARLKEEENFGEPIVGKIERWLDYDFRGQEVLVVGAGTGAEAVVLARRGARVRGLEPHPQAHRILQLKAGNHHLDPAAFVRGRAEAIPFPGDTFDFVFCYTVLEHVQEVDRALDEMLRVCKPGGLVFLQLPDYRFPYESHYKVWLIPFGPRWLQALYLKWRGRPTEYFWTLNFLTGPNLDRRLWQRNVDVLRINEPYLLLWKDKRFQYFFTRLFAIPSQQNIFLKKRWER